MSKSVALRALALLMAPLLFAEPAHAYLDPGSGSMLLTLIMGGIAGVGVAVRLYWRRLIAFITGKKLSEGEQASE